MWLLLALLALLVLIPIGGLAVLSIRSRQAPTLGAVDGRLRPCPKGSQNCVCSQSEVNSIAPIPYSGSAEDALARMESLINTTAGGSVVERSPNYLHAEFRTRLFRFIDDVEILVDQGRGVLHVRSASRVGKSDLGANRERVELLRERFKAMKAE